MCPDKVKTMERSKSWVLKIQIMEGIHLKIKIGLLTNNISSDEFLKQYLMSKFDTDMVFNVCVENL